MTTTFIYGLVDPRDNQIKYVGKSDHPKKRLRQHLVDYSNQQKQQWVKELKAASLTPILLVLAEVAADEWDTQERYWIQKLQDEGCSLLNIQAGGCHKGNYAAQQSQLKLKRPTTIRDRLGKKGWLTIAELAAGLNMSTRTIARALRGEPVRAKTIRTIAQTLGEGVADIATFVN